MGTEPARARKTRLTREEKAQRTYAGLMRAAEKVVGERGYAATSIARVTEEAGVSHGTFYNYFADRQELFDELLPYVGRQMTDAITEAVRATGGGVAREAARIRAYCRYLEGNPGFYRILYEAEVFAPKAFEAHVTRLSEGYRRALDRAVAAGDIHDYGPEELDAVVAALLGARAYIAMRFMRDGKIPESAIQGYVKLVGRGLFG